MPPGQTNRVPIAGPDVARTPAGAPVVIDARANDFDPDGDPIAIEGIAEQPQNGAVVIREDGRLVYTPNEGFAGTDSFVYTLVDGYRAPAGADVPEELRGPGRSLGEVLVGVMPQQPVNRDPVALDDAGFAPVRIGNGSVVLDVLNNDFDPDEDDLVVTEVTVAAVGEAIAREGWVEYVPPARW